MEGFYNVHCTNCGKVLGADRMAIDVDRILREHLAKMAGRNVKPIYIQAKKLFDEIRIGMYLTRFEMTRDHIMDSVGTIRLTCQYILEFIGHRYKTKIDINTSRPGEDGQEEEVSSFDMFDKLDTRDEQLDSEWETWEDESAFKVPDDVLDSLCFKMALYSERDNSEEDKRRYIRELLQFLAKEGDFVILECDCQFSVSKDDRGENEFVSALQVTYFDGDTVAYNHMVCPNCGETFFINAGKHEEKVIVMLGSSRVGKTAYLAALVNELNPKYGQPRYKNITVKDTPDRRYTFFRDHILNQYVSGNKILKTDETKEAVALFSLDMLINGNSVILTFVDLPGEVFVPRNKEELEEGEASGRFIINHRKICYSADAFWFCVDPVQLDQRLHYINEESSATDKVELDMGMVLANIENSLHIMGNEKTSAPTAVIITKSDLIDPESKLYFSDKSQEQTCLLNEKQFLADRFYSVAENVKRYMLSEQVRNIVSQLNYMFSRKNYFAVAAYGVKIEEGVSKGRKPYGIVLPFLWTMTALGYLQPVKCMQKVVRTGKFFNRKEEIVSYYEAVDREELFSVN